MSKQQQVLCRLEELRTVADKFGYRDLFTNLVDHWITEGSSSCRVGVPLHSSETRNQAEENGTDRLDADLDEKRGKNALETSSAVSTDIGLKTTLDKMNTVMTDLAATIRSSHVDRAVTDISPIAAGIPENTVEEPARSEEQAAPSAEHPAPPAVELAPPATEQAASAAEQPAQPAAANAPIELVDLFKGSLPEEPWQNKRYSPDNRIWQAAAMRRRQHTRRTNTSLGVCTVDLSGPHEPSPRLGRQIHKDPVTYFLVLTLRPDRTAETVGMAVQTDDADHDVEPADPEPQARVPDRPLLYAALLGSKAEAADAVKELLAQINDDHASLPHTLYFRLHSDRGGEFLSEELREYCRQHAIHKTTAQGNDPNANASAELGVGTLKRRCRYLLSGNRLPTMYWGVGILAAAQLERADLGVGSYPRIPFGTRGMVVTSPPPRNAWTPRAEPCTIFGTCDDIPGAQWIYQKGWIKPRTDLQPEGLSEDDLVWIKLSVKNWDAPDCPLELPEAADFDAGAVLAVRPGDLPAATRESATCEACLQTRRGRRQTRAHSYVWGVPPSTSPCGSRSGTGKQLPSRI